MGNYTALARASWYRDTHPRVPQRGQVGWVDASGDFYAADTVSDIWYLAVALCHRLGETNVAVDPIGAGTEAQDPCLWLEDHGWVAFIPTAGYGRPVYGRPLSEGQKRAIIRLGGVL